MLGRIVALQVRRLLFASSVPFSADTRVTHKAKLAKYNTYFEQVLPVIGNECGDIIRELGKERPNMMRVNTLLDDYLQFHQEGNFIPRTLEGVLNIIIAIDMGGFETLSKYKFMLLEQVNRVKLEDTLMAPVTINYFLATMIDYRKSAKEKMKSSRLLFNLMVVLDNNFAAVEPQRYYSILQILTSEINYQQYLVKIARLIQKHTTALLRKVEAKEPLPSGIEKIFSEQFLCLLSETYKTYGTDSAEDFQVFFKFIEKKFLNKYFTGLLESRYAYCNSLFRNFNYDLIDERGINYKQMLFERIVQTFLSTPKNITAFARSKHGYYFCSSVLTHQFYQHAQTLRF
jgi:hypothetical protein